MKSSLEAIKPLVLWPALLALAGCTAPAAAPPASSTTALSAHVDWPAYGPERKAVVLRGITNNVPDVVGPIDGSAKLTLFTEGNHYPVFLPLVLDGFPAWCRQTGRCTVDAGEILVVTLPQVMVVDALLNKSLQFGNAVLPLSANGAVFPDLVFGGAAPIGRLAAAGLVEPKARVLARHKGLGLLVPVGSDVQDLKGFAARTRSLVVATPGEAGARRQYVKTLAALLGEQAGDALMARAVADFPGRLGIQHRDVPYALLNGVADGGILFGHLARFYAQRWPQQLRFIEVPQAAPFGEQITVVRTARQRTSPLREVFLEYLFSHAAKAYADGGFAEAATFPFGQQIEVKPAPAPASAPAQRPAS